MMELLKQQILQQKPTDQQRDSIFSDDLEFLIRASPGSGKTWTSCRRFIWRAANRVTDIGGIALLSFTNTAVQEFYDATSKVGKRFLLSDPNYAGTFDSFAERHIIAPFGHLITKTDKRPKLFIAPRPGDRANNNLMAWTKLRGRNMQVPAWEIIPYPEKGVFKFKASKTFGGKDLEFGQINPIENLFKLGYYTHSQRIYLACRVLIERPHIAKVLARRFPEIIVDEAQDSNIWLLYLLHILREQGSCITLVGDPDQCIYEFSMADSSFLESLQKRWGISEKPLDESFRCNNEIANSVRNISGNTAFIGCGERRNDYCRPYIIREVGKKGHRKSIDRFNWLLEKAKIKKIESAILCRGHKQLESISGDVNYNKLQGTTKLLAEATYHRDIKKDYNRAYHIVTIALKGILDEPDFWELLEEQPDSEQAFQIRLTIWKFVKSEDGLPTLNMNGVDWVLALKENLQKLISFLGISNVPKLGHKIRKTGLNESQLIIPLFEEQRLFPTIRQETIHKVKGESIDAVLVLGATGFFNKVVEAIDNNQSIEERRLAYVAMTRARHSLLVSLPDSHFKKYSDHWLEWGFKILEN